MSLKNKIMGVVLEEEFQCFSCNGEGVRDYPVYHNDYEEGICDGCKGTGIRTSSTMMSLSDFAALIQPELDKLKTE